MNNLGMEALVVSVYKRYGALLFEDAVQLQLFLANPSNSSAVAQIKQIRYTKWMNQNIQGI